jgi:hypothetical protein
VAAGEDAERTPFSDQVGRAKDLPGVMLQICTVTRIHAMARLSLEIERGGWPHSEFAKLCGARAFFGHFVALAVTKIIKFIGKIDSHQK